MHFEKFKGVDFKYSNSVFQILAQKYPEKSFLVLSLKPFHFGWNFAIPQIVGCWFQIWKQLLKIAAQKYPNKTTFGSNLVFCVLHETLHIEKLKGADFKYDNIFFSNSALKYPNDTILVPGLRVFCGTNLLKFELADLKPGYILFKEIPAQYCSHKAFPMRNFWIFPFYRKLCTQLVLRAQKRNYNIIFVSFVLTIMF